MTVRSGGQPRVAMVSPGWPVEHFFNGIVSYTTRMKCAMEAAGARVTILSDPVIGDFGADVVRFDGARIHTRTWERLLYKALVRVELEYAVARSQGRAIGEALRRISEGGGLDVVQIPDAYGWSHYLRPASPAPVVVRLHGPWFFNEVMAEGVRPDRKYRRRVARERLGIAGADGISSPSLAVLEATREYYGLELAGARVIATPIEPLAERDLWRGSGSGPRRIVFVGRFDRHKGGDLVIEAFARVAARRGDVRLMFVGPDRGVQTRAWGWLGIREFIERVAPEAGVRERIEWLGKRTPAEIRELRAGASVVVVPSRWENFANTLLESVIAGCPTVASRTGGLPEIVEHERNGLLCEADSVESLAHEVGRLLDDGSLAKRLGGRALADALERYSPATAAREHLAFYEAVAR
ncbi:MAG: glycosyltransferase family 4 protein [Phycisphaeraceae bacterium]|nr:glycosyltransferase family 4 protein [Phycisphaeraceae bacterium]